MNILNDIYSHVINTVLKKDIRYLQWYFPYIVIAWKKFNIKS